MTAARKSNEVDAVFSDSQSLREWHFENLWTEGHIVSDIPPGEQCEILKDQTPLSARPGYRIPIELNSS